MKDKYDFSKAERSKFYHANVLQYFSEKAKGVEINAMVNELLKKDIAIIEGVIK